MSKYLYITLVFNWLSVQAQPTSCPTDYTFCSSLFSDRCCDDQHFNYNSLQKYYGHCSSLPAKNVDASLADSYWYLFECLVTSVLNVSSTNEPLTLLNFAKLMAADLTNKTKSTILGQIKMNEKLTSSNDIKWMWDLYFELEFKACTEMTENDNKTAQTSARGSRFHRRDHNKWAPSDTCGSSKHPSIPPPSMSYQSVEFCQKLLIKNYKFPNMTRSDIYDLTDPLCRLIKSGILQEKELTASELDFEKITAAMLPSFWSTKTRDLAFKKLPIILAPDVTLNGTKIKMESLTNVFILLKNMIKDKIDLMQGDKETDLFYTNIFILSQHLTPGVAVLERNICKYTQDKTS